MAGEVFNKPVPQEALDYFNSKDLKIGFDYRDVWRAEHAYSFTVAKAMTANILEDIQSAASKAIKEGKTFHQFQKELKPILQKKGWWGRKDMRDPVTGEVKDAQLGSPRRLKTIYRANMRTARGAGKWERIQRTKEALPYLLYQLGPSERHRPEHAAWNGIMLPVDDTFWQTHFTPNGWGCKCWIRQISKNEYGRLKSRDEYSTTAPLINNENWVNKRTGAIEKVPKGIHPGWNTNAGLVRQVILDRELLNKTYANDAFMQSVILSKIRQDDYKSWVDTVLQTGHGTGAIATVGIMGESETQWLKTKGLEPTEKLIVLEDRLLVGKKAQRHEQAGNALVPKEWKALLANLAKAEVIFFDNKNQTLLYVYSSSDKKTKLAVAIDFKLKNKTAKTAGLLNIANAIRSGFKVKPEDIQHHLNNGDYTLIKGEMQ